MPSIYLDLCCLNRPFDDQHQPRVRLEAEAVLGLLQLARLGELTLISSEILDLECCQTPDEDRRWKVATLLSLARSKVVAGAVSGIAAEICKRSDLAHSTLCILRVPKAPELTFC